MFLYISCLNEPCHCFLVCNNGMNKGKREEIKMFCQNPQFLFYGVKEFWHKGL